MFKQKYNLGGGFRYQATEFMRGMGIGYRAAKTPFRLAGKALHGLERMSQQASHVPMLDSFLNLVIDEPVFAETMAAVDSLNTTLDDLGQIGSEAGKFVNRGFDSIFGMEAEAPDFRFFHSTQAPRFDEGFVPAPGFNPAPRSAKNVAPIQTDTAAQNASVVRSTRSDADSPGTPAGRISFGGIE